MSNVLQFKYRKPVLEKIARRYATAARWIAKTRNTGSDYAKALEYRNRALRLLLCQTHRDELEALEHKYGKTDFAAEDKGVVNRVFWISYDLEQIAFRQAELAAERMFKDKKAYKAFEKANKKLKLSPGCIW
jgi:transposase